MSHPEREVHDLAAIRAMIDAQQVCRIAVNDEPAPYIVPVNFGYQQRDGRWRFYFHGARTGKKMRLLRRDPTLSLEIDGDHRLITADDACDYGYAYSSVIAAGRAVFVDEREEMARGLDLIMRQMQPGKTFSYREKMLQAVCVVRIDCDWLTCRRNPFPD